MAQIVRVNNILADGTVVTVYPAGDQPFPTDRPTLSRMGVNLDGPNDYSVMRPFIDVVKTARQPWGSVDIPYADGSIPVDADGWPEDDFGVLLFSGQSNVGGDYKFSFTGVADIPSNKTNFTVVSKTYDAGTNTTSGVLRFPESDTSMNGYVAFTNTAREPESDPGITNLKILRPGYANDDAIFTKTFLSLVEPFGVIRFMDALKTNGNLTESWNDRSKLTSATWSLKTGWPYEVILKFMQVTGKDVWINIPAHANEEFYDELSDLLRSETPQGQRVYFEYSNEVWNGLFEQFDYNTDQAELENAADSGLYGPYVSVQNKYYWGWCRTAAQCAKLKVKLCPELVASGIDDPRFRAIYATQLGYSPAGHQVEQAFNHIADYYAPPEYIFEAIAVAPYYGTSNTTSSIDWNSDSLTAEEVANAILYGAQDNTASKTRFIDFRNMAANYGVKLFAYEGGNDITQANHSVPAKSAAQKLLQVGKAVETSVGSWLSTDPNTIYCYFNVCSKNNANGYWGLTDKQTDLSQPKYVAASKLAKQYTMADSMTLLPPTGLRVKLGTKSNVQLYWYDNTWIETGYRIEKKVGTGDWATLVTLKSNIGYYSDTAVTPGTNYTYRVFALGNADAVSEPSNEATITYPIGTPTVPPPVVPTAPTSLTATALTASSVSLGWTDTASNEYGFRLERATPTGWAVIATLTPNTVSFTDSNATPNTTHKYRVAALGDTNSPYSNTATVTTPQEEGPTTELAVVPWGVCANVNDILDGLKIVFRTIKADGAEWVRFWASPFDTISTANIDRMKAAKAAGLKVCLALQGKDGSARDFGHPDMAYWVTLNKGALKNVDVVEAGNEINLAQYRYNDWGGVNAWHGSYVGLFLKPLYQALKPLGVRVALVSLTWTGGCTCIYGDQLALLEAAGAKNYCDDIAIHMYMTPSTLSAIPGIISEIRTEWPGKRILVTEANVNFNGLSSSAHATQFTNYATVLRSTGKVDAIMYYRAMERSDGLAGNVALFNKAGVVLPRYAVVKGALTN